MNPLRLLFVLVRMRVLETARSATSLALFMALPVILLLAVGAVFSQGQPFERKAVALTGSGDGVARVGLALDGEPELRLGEVESEARGRALLAARMANVVIVARPGEDLRLLGGPRDVFVSRGIAATLAPLPVRIETVPVPRWGYVHYVFPGLLTFAVMIAGLFGMGYAMVRYRETLLLKKLATTPLPRSLFVFALILARVVLVTAQVIVMVVVGKVAFGVPVSGGALGWLALVTVLGLLAFTGAGFALACVVRSEGLIVDVINAVNTFLVFFSEIFFPLSELPPWLARLCALLPSTIMVRLVRETLLFGAADTTLLLHGVAGLGVWTVLAYLLALRLFKWT